MSTPKGIAFTGDAHYFVIEVDTRSFIRAFFMQLLPIAFTILALIMLYRFGERSTVAFWLIQVVILPIVLFTYRKKLSMNLAGSITFNSDAKGLHVAIKSPLFSDYFSTEWSNLKEVGHQHYQSNPSGSFSKGNQEFGIALITTAKKPFIFGMGYLDKEQQSFLITILQASKNLRT